MKKRALLFAISVLGLGCVSAAQTGMAKSLSEVKFENDGKPACLDSALEHGNPETGPSTFILRASPGCLVAWHNHTAEEQLIVVGGDVFAEMAGTDGKKLGAGGYALMPSKVNHQFACRSKDTCVMFVTFDRKYDIVWVKEAGKAPR